MSRYVRKVLHVLGRAKYLTMASGESMTGEGACEIAHFVEPGVA